MNLWKITREVFHEIKQQGLTLKKISGSVSLYYLYDMSSNGSRNKPLAILSFEEDKAYIDLIDRQRESRLGTELQKYLSPERKRLGEYH